MLDLFKPKLSFTIGLPRSGKSTFCEQWVQKRDDKTVKGTMEAMASREYIIWNRNPRVIVSGDSFRRALHGHSYINNAEGMVFASMDVAIKALLLSGHDVIVDETSTTKGTILRYLRIDINAEPIWIDTPAEVCKQRAIDTNKPYLLGPIDRMAAQLAELKADWPNNFERMKQYLLDRKENDVVAL